MGGDGASIDDELRRQLRYLMNSLGVADLTAAELRAVRAIFESARQRIEQERAQG